MDKIEFACFLTRLQNVLNVHIEPDIVAMMYKEYIRTYFEKYTLFQLISMLDKHKVYMPKLNKKAILLNQELDMECKLADRYSAPNTTTWGVYNMKYIDYTAIPYSRNISENIICVTNSGARTELMIGDVFQINNDNCVIFKIPNDTHITLFLKNEETNMSIAEFMQMLDKEDVTIKRNQLRVKPWHMDAKYYTKISQ